MDRQAREALGSSDHILGPGAGSFLLSRKVLQGMEATLDLGKCTMTSAKHGIQDEPLMQAPNGICSFPWSPPMASKTSCRYGKCRHAVSSSLFKVIRFLKNLRSTPVKKNPLRAPSKPRDPLM